MLISTRSAALSLLLVAFVLMFAGSVFAADPPKPATAPAAPKPVATTPAVVATPVPSKPVAPKPVVSKSPAATPATTKPASAKPVAAQPPAAKPATPKKKPVVKAAAKSKKSAPAFKYTADNTLVWRGDLATSRSIVTDVAELYEKSAKVHIEIQPFSTISGLDAVASGKADLAGSARGAHEGRVEEANLNFVPQALDAIVPVVHPRNPISGLSLRQLRQIYLGRVRNWKEVGGLDAPINLYAVAAPMDGVEYTMRQLLYGKGTQGISAPRLYVNTGSMEEGITLDPNALGLSTLSAVGGRADLKMLSVAGVAPSVPTVQSGSYPLYATLYLVTRNSDPRQAMIDAFLAFMATPEATQLMRDHRLVPISDVANSVERNQTRDAFIQSELAREPVPVPGASPGVDVTPVSAPNATAAAKTAVAPAAGSTMAAQQRAAIEKSASASDAAQTAKNKAATDKAKAEDTTPIGKK